MNNALKDLIRVSNITGSDPAFVQGGGGNTSAKTADGKYMYIKASGTALKYMNAVAGWRRLRIDKLIDLVNDTNLLQYEDPQKRESQVVKRLAETIEDELESGARPSVEAHLHALLDKYVIHLHPIAVGAYVNAKDGRRKLERVLRDEKKPFLWVPYVDPGLMLAKKIQGLIERYEKQHSASPQVLILEKHGIFVTASTANAALALVKRVIRKCDSKLRPLTVSKVKNIDKRLVSQAKLVIRGAYFGATGQRLNVEYFYDKRIAAFMRDKNAKKMLNAGTLNPDELVYANGAALYVETLQREKVEKALRTRIERGGKAPAAFLVKDMGLFAAASRKNIQTIHDIVQSSFFIRMNAMRMGGISALNKRQADFIRNWEAESFRKKLLFGEEAGVLKDMISVVTGAGSGLGRSIAVGLARAGAAVGLADIDTKAAQETAQIIGNELPSAQTCVLSCNVTDENSVDAAFDTLLGQWGGLDVLVNAAGVAPAGPLVETPVDKWRFALEVNLTGYMLMARSAARILTQQGIGGSIINISSKSGIEASKNNSAYNATKAGELHLTRGWAMELGPRNIRVNAVCPGNVFEGSKIWNPQYIRECAKKYGIKPEEVIPFYVSRTMLNLEIKGQDIADSVVFLASEKARRITGQTLVVDAGQAPVR